MCSYLPRDQAFIIIKHSVHWGIDALKNTTPSFLPSLPFNLQIVQDPFLGNSSSMHIGFSVFCGSDFSLLFVKVAPPPPSSFLKKVTPFFQQHLVKVEVLPGSTFFNILQEVQPPPQAERGQHTTQLKRVYNKYANTYLQQHCNNQFPIFCNNFYDGSYNFKCIYF